MVRARRPGRLRAVPLALAPCPRTGLHASNEHCTSGSAVGVVGLEPVCKFVNDPFLYQVLLVSCRVASGLVVARKRLRFQRRVW